MNNETRNMRNVDAPVATTKTAAGLAAFKRISWGAVFAGVVIALTVQLCLSLLGLGIGMGTINPTEESNPFSGLGTGSLIWWVVSMLIALFAGGWVAGRLAGIPRTFDSVLHGVLTWSVFTLLSFYLLTTTIGRIVSGVGGVVGSTLSAAGQGIAAVAPEAASAIQGELNERGIDLNTIKNEARQLLRETGKDELQPENLEREARQAGQDVKAGASNAATNPQQAEASLNNAIDNLFARGSDVVREVDRSAAVNVVMERTGKSRAESEQIVDGWIQRYNQAKTQFNQAKTQAAAKARQTGKDVASAVSKAGIFAFIGLVLGAVAAGFGGKTGEPHDVAVNGTITP